MNKSKYDNEVAFLKSKINFVALEEGEGSYQVKVGSEEKFIKFFIGFEEVADSFYYATMIVYYIKSGLVYMLPSVTNETSEDAIYRLINGMLHEIEDKRLKPLPS